MSTTTDVAGEYRLIEIGKLHESPLNPRKLFAEGPLQELAASIRESGIITPLIVRPNAKGFEIAAGHRRYRAAKLAELLTLPTIVREMDDKTFVEILNIENLQRQDMTALEEAEGYRLLMTKAAYKVERIAERVGRSPQYIYDRIKLLELVPEAAKLLRDDLITAGHAILLARLKPEDQKRIVAIDKESHDNESVLMKADAVLLTDEEEDKLSDTKKWPMKAISVRELEAYIAKHVRFKPAETDSFLLPETAAAVQSAVQQKEKIVEITYDSFVQEEARQGRTIRAGYWQRADGKDKSKTCEYAVTGVVVVGPGQGEAFKVCVNREKCEAHWGKEIKARAKRAAAPAGKSKASADTAYERQQQQQRQEQVREEAARIAFRKARPAILEAIAEKVGKASVRQLGDYLLSGNRNSKKAAEYIGRGSSAEDLVRHLAFIDVAAHDGDYDYARQELSRVAKDFGVDVKKIVDAAAPKAKPEAKKEAPKKKAKK